MRFCSHITSDYACTRHCGFHRSIVTPNLSLFHITAAAMATVPLWVLSLQATFPWYYVVSIFACEILLVFLAGLVSTFLLSLFLPSTTICKKCGAPLFFAGRHFDPSGSPKAHWTDITIFAIFLLMNLPSGSH